MSFFIFLLSYDCFRVSFGFIITSFTIAWRHICKLLWKSKFKCSMRIHTRWCLGRIFSENQNPDHKTHTRTQHNMTDSYFRFRIIILFLLLCIKRSLVYLRFGRLASVHVCFDFEFRIYHSRLWKRSFKLSKKRYTRIGITKHASDKGTPN